MKNKLFSLNLTLLLSILLILTSGCSNIKSRPSTGISKSAVYFDTFVNITIYDNIDNTDDILSNCLGMCSDYEQLFDSNIPTSDISKINSSCGTPTIVNPETIYLLNKAVQYSSSTNGLFDVTIYSASKCWNFHDSSNQLPDKATILNAVKHIDYQNIIINEASNTIQLTDPDSQIDIGGIAKGYIADKIAAYLIDAGISNAIINMGGDMVLLGSKNSTTPYTIGINDPFNSGAARLALSLSSCAVATSGTYERYIEQNNIRYHHILNPRTGYPIDTDLVSSTIICHNSTDADTLCTISILLGSDDALSYIEAIPNCEGIFITADGDILKTSGADKYIKY